MIQRITVQQVQGIYNQSVHAGHLADFGKLDGAVNAPFQEVFGLRPYPTLLHKASKLVEGISRAQAYSDGNKRLAWLTGVTFLQINGLVLCELTDEECAAFVLGLHGHEDGLKDGVRWLNDRLTDLI